MPVGVDKVYKAREDYGRVVGGVAPAVHVAHVKLASFSTASGAAKSPARQCVELHWVLFLVDR